MKTGARQFLMFFLFAAAFWGQGLAQRGLGFRFATGFNHFFRADEYPLIDGSWSNVILGTYYQEYFSNGGVQAGLNFVAKNNTDRGFPNLPLVMRDFRAGQNVGVVAMEFDFKVGPRFGPFNPRIGYVMGYWFKREGFLSSDTSTVRLNRWYVMLPFVAAVQLPTDYGSVGFAIGYDVGLNNIIKNPDPGNIVNYNGSRIRALKIELNVLFGFRRQAPKKTPPVPPAQ